MYVNNADNGRITLGDVIWIRSANNDGIAIGGYTFRMINKQNGNIVCELTLVELF